MNVHSFELPAGYLLKDGRYSVVESIGRGGFGITYRATDETLGRAVAIKEFFMAGSHRTGATVGPPQGLEQEFTERRNRIRDEARTLAQFKHPAIVTVHDVFEENSTIYVVMELLEGRTLGELITQAGGPLPEEQVVTYVREIGAALDAVHAKTLLHRDIKPDNVIIMSDGHAALVDFGTAREFDLAQSSLMSRVLTPGYAPVEQYTARGRFGPPTDVYALGATMYHAVTGRAPTPSLDRFTGQELTPPHEINDALTRAVSDTIVWAMSLESEDRPQTAGEFVAALSAASPTLPDPASTRIVEVDDGDATIPIEAPAPQMPVEEVTATPTTTVGAGKAPAVAAAPAAAAAAPTVASPAPPGTPPESQTSKRLFSIVVLLIALAGAAAAVVWLSGRDTGEPTVLPTQAPIPTTAPGRVTPPPQTTPTTTPEPTVPPTAPPPAPITWHVVDVPSDDVLNVRLGPGVRYDPPIDELQYDQVGIIVTGNVAHIGSGFWTEVELVTGSGWASLRFLEASNAEAEPNLLTLLGNHPGATEFDQPRNWLTVANVPVRSGPGLEHAVLVQFPGGVTVNATGDIALVNGTLWVEVESALGPVWLKAEQLSP